ncbi:MAG TPA: hypothetical protein VIO64_17785 [Pseudobacteroides sp.]|uniref:hypothetical protein n=1 Tax=Pseudobacteroides sp. TaxID=1968840 RepID=UPI002F93D320
MVRLKSTIFQILVVTLTICLPTVGCGNKNNGPSGQQQSAQGGQSKETTPDVLTGIEENIESIITALKGPSVPKDEDSTGDAKSGKQSKEKSTQSEESKGKQEGDKSSEEGGGSKSSESPSPSESTPSPKEGNTETKPQSSPAKPSPQDPWAEITPLVNSLHYQWNELRPEATSKGASRELTDNFSNSLNSLTNTIITKNKENTLMESNKLYSYIPDLLYLYKSKASPELKRVKYYTRNSILNSLAPNWPTAESDITSLKSSWSTYKNTIDKKQHENVSKLDYSINELEKVIKDKNQPLIDIKGRVVLTNINTLEKASEE